MADAGQPFDPLDHAWRIHANAQDLIKYADQKVQVVLALGTLLTGYVSSKADTVAALGAVGYVLLAAFAAAAAVFFGAALRALLARSDTKTGGTVPRLIYFGHIAQRREAAEYAAELRFLSPAAALDDVAYQIAELGNIAAKKFGNYRCAWWALAGMAVPTVVLAAHAFVPRPAAEAHTGRTPRDEATEKAPGAPAPGRPGVGHTSARDSVGPPSTPGRGRP
jgi:hypothetical protein